MQAEGLLEILRRHIGVESVVSDPDLTLRYAIPWGGQTGDPPRAVVRPLDAEQAAALLRICTDLKQPVVLQGGNTGLVRGAEPRANDLVLSTERMADIGSVDEQAMHGVVGAGTTLDALQRHLHPHGLELPVDLGSRGQATLGGMAATNAGGARAFQHGTMRAQVMGIEAVLADGTVIHRLRGVVKDSTGYDWASLLIGSEGTLGLITQLQLRLRRPQPSRAAALVGLDSLDAALELAVGMRNRCAWLEAAEFLLPSTVALVCDTLDLTFPSDAAADGLFVLFEVRAPADALEVLAGALSEEGAAETGTLLADGSEADRLWRYREGTGEALVHRGPLVKLDVSLPLSHLAAGIAEIERVARRIGGPRIEPYLFGHLLDGNVHVNLGAVESDRVVEVERAVLKVVLRHGGSIGAEHGVGRAKSRWLAEDRSPVEVAAMRRVKAALDPANILNPGALFAN